MERDIEAWGVLTPLKLVMMRGVLEMETVAAQSEGAYFGESDGDIWINRHDANDGLPIEWMRPEVQSNLGDLAGVGIYLSELEKDDNNTIPILRLADKYNALRILFVRGQSVQQRTLDEHVSDVEYAHLVIRINAQTLRGDVIRVTTFFDSESDPGVGKITTVGQEDVVVTVKETYIARDAPVILFDKDSKQQLELRDETRSAGIELLRMFNDVIRDYATSRVTHHPAQDATKRTWWQRVFFT